MRVAVIDIGSNTARLLVADVDGTLEPVREERTYLGLAADILRHGSVSPPKLDDAATVAGRYARLAERLDADDVAAVVTAPGRQGRASAELVAALTKAVGQPVSVLSAVEEGRFAFLGATARLEADGGIVAVCDVGGGSTQIAVGSPDEDPAWVRSVDIGSLRLTRRALSGETPTTKAVARARDEVDRVFAGLTPPLPQSAYATGGSARALGKVVGPRLGAEELAVALHVVSERSTRLLAKTFDLSPARANTLVAGTLLLAATQRLLGVPLIVARAGVRDGVAISLLEQAAVAA